MTDTVNIKLPKLHAGQLEVYQSRKRFKVVYAGRRWGKTQYGATELFKAAVTKPGLYWWVGLSWQSASMKRAWSVLTKYCSQIPGATINNSKFEIRLPNDSQIWCRTAENPQSLDGEGVNGVVIDEFTLMPAKIWFRHVRPTLMDFRGWAIFIGVPKGKNWGYHIYLRGMDPENKQWASFRQPTHKNPYILVSEIEEIEKDLTREDYRQEVLADILESDGQVFTGIQGCVSDCERDGPETATALFILACDIAKLNDYTVVTVWDAKLKQRVAMHRFHHEPYTQVARRIKEIAAYWNHAATYVERNSVGEAVVDALLEMGVNAIGVQTTASSKPQMILALQIAIERGELEFPGDPVTINELEAYQKEVLPSGTVRYGAPEGYHDDVVMSMALAATVLRDYVDDEPLGRIGHAF